MDGDRLVIKSAFLSWLVKYILSSYISFAFIEEVNSIREFGIADFIKHNKQRAINILEDIPIRTPCIQIQLKIPRNMERIFPSISLNRAFLYEY